MPWVGIKVRRRRTARLTPPEMRRLKALEDENARLN